MRACSSIALGLGVALTLAPFQSAFAANPGPDSPLVSLKFRGPLREALARIAHDAHVNLVITGKVDETTDIYFDDVPARDALASIAKTYHLEIERNGRIWTLKPEAPSAPVRLVPPVPPTPPSPMEVVAPSSGDSTDEADDDAASEAAEEQDSDSSDIAQRIRERIEEKTRHGVHVSVRTDGRTDGDSDAVGHGDVNVGPDETVNDAVAYGGSVNVEGKVEGDVVAFGGSVHLGPHAEVDGDVTAFGGAIRRESGAQVHGEVVNFGGSGMGKAIASTARRAVEHDNHSRHGSSESFFSGVPWFLLQFALYFGLGFLFIMFAPSRMKLIESELMRDPVKSGLVGFAGAVALIPLSVLLAVTIVGVVLIPVLWIGAVLAVVAGYAAISSEIGTLLPFLSGRRKTQAAVLALGILVLLVVSRIPYLGVFTLVVLGAVALGAVIRTRFGSTPKGFPEPF